MQVYEVIQKLAKGGKNNDLLNKLLHKNIVALSSEEQNVIALLRKDTSYGVSVEDLQYQIDKIKLTYAYYSKVEYDGVLSSWDRRKARFFIKEKYEAKQK